MKKTITKKFTLATKKQFVPLACRSAIIRYSFNPNATNLLIESAIQTAYTTIRKMNCVQCTPILRAIESEAKVLVARSIEYGAQYAYKTADCENFGDIVNVAIVSLTERAAKRPTDAPKNWLLVKKERARARIDIVVNSTRRRSGTEFTSDLQCVYRDVRRYVESMHGARAASIVPYIEIDADNCENLTDAEKAAYSVACEVGARAYFKTEYAAATLREKVNFDELVKHSCKTSSDLKLIKLLNAGLTLRECAEKMRVSYDAVEHRRADIAKRAAEYAAAAPRLEKSTAYHVSQSVTLEKDGKATTFDSIRAAAAAIGVTDGAIRKAVKACKPCHGYSITVSTTPKENATAAPKVGRRYAESPLDASVFENAMQIFKV